MNRRNSKKSEINHEAENGILFKMKINDKHKKTTLIMNTLIGLVIILMLGCGTSSTDNGTNLPGSDRNPVYFTINIHIGPGSSGHYCTIEKFYLNGKLILNELINTENIYAYTKVGYGSFGESLSEFENNGLEAVYAEEIIFIRTIRNCRCLNNG
jgi:hypothetical protein